MYGSIPFGLSPWGGSPPVVDVPDEERGPVIYDDWKLRLEDKGGDTFLNLIFTEAEYIEAVNEPSRLRVQIPQSFAFGTNGELFNVAIFPDVVSVQNRRGETIDRCRIVRSSYETVSGDYVVTLEAFGLMADLGKVSAEGYSAENRRTCDIIADLLNLQTGTFYRKIRRGWCVPTEEVSIEAEPSDSVLSMLRKLREAIGGIMWVDANYRLHWKFEPYRFAGRRIRPYMNSSSIGIEMDHTAIHTTVIVEGKNDMVAMATDESEYGPTIPFRVSRRDISNQDVLDKIAADTLEIVRAPQKRITAGWIDLSAIQTNFSWEDLRLAEIVEVMYPGEIFDEKFRVTSVRRRLHDEMGSSLEIDTINKQPSRYADIIDQIAQLMEGPEAQPVPYSDDDPLGLGVADPGESFDLSRADHVHPLPDGEVLFDLVEPYLPPPPTPPELSDDIPEKVAQDAGAAGTSIRFTRSDHVHRWDIMDFEYAKRQFTGTNLAGLNIAGGQTLRNGDTAYTTGDNQHWIRSNGQWEPNLRFTT